MMKKKQAALSQIVESKMVMNVTHGLLHPSLENVGPHP
jgi:hypothetical protein